MSDLEYLPYPEFLQVLEPELAQTRAALEAAQSQEALQLILYRAQVAAHALEHPLEPFLMALQHGQARAEDAVQHHWLEAYSRAVLTILANVELDQVRSALAQAKNADAVALALYRARVVYTSIGHELANTLNTLESTPLSQDPEVRAWQHALEQHKQLESTLLEPVLEAVFNREMEQRLLQLRQAKDPQTLRLEVHRLRVAAHTVLDPVELELSKLEAGEMTVQDPRLRAALPISRTVPEKIQPEPVRSESSRQDLASSLVGQSILPPGVTRFTDTSLDGVTIARAAQESVRVPVARLDSLLAQAGELTVGRIRIEERMRDLRKLLSKHKLERRNVRQSRVLRRRLQSLVEKNRDVMALLGLLETNEESTRKAFDQLDLVINRLALDLAQLRTVNSIIEDEVLSVRLLPAAMLFPPLERLVRDLGQQLGKKVRFETVGGAVGVDRKILDGLRDPLMHMIRNSLDHGLELPQVRQAQGKPEIGSIVLAVSSSDGVVLITLSDDGAGIDPAKIMQKAQEKGLIQANFDPKLALDLIFEPGFSMAAAVTEVSGRGVGMDVVRQNIRALGGTVSVQSQPQQGSQFVLRLPAQLATVRVLLVRVGDETFALPTTNIERTGRVKIETIHQLEGRNVIVLAGRPVPVVELGGVLDVPFLVGEAWQPYVVLRRDEDRLALTVDAMLGEQEVVVKKLSYPLERFALLEGAAMLGSGQLVAILSSMNLLERGLKREIRVRRDLKLVPQVAARVPRIMVVDDSITSRTLERSILEAAGFETITAVHGAQALEFLRRGEVVDLVVSDVEMPELDGFGLTTEIRRDPRLAQIPVILITSLNAPEHKERGAAAGADAYIVKGEFDQGVLLETINRLL
ncbi:MAG: response regulator [Deinococcales bacterium]